MNSEWLITGSLSLTNTGMICLSFISFRLQAIVFASTKKMERQDTSINITGYKYDSKGNKVEEDVLLGNPSFRNANWYNNGEELTSKTIFRYDAHNNLIEKRQYYTDPNDEHYKSIYGSKGFRFES